MANAVSPSEVKMFSRGQAGKFADLVIAAALKLGLPSDVSQQVIEEDGAKIAKAAAEIFRQHVEARMKTLARTVAIDSGHTPMHCVEATGRNKYVTDSVVSSMPRSPGGEVTLELYCFGKYMPCAEVEAWQNAPGYRAAFPDELLKMNEDDPAFADERPNGTQWKDAQGKYCFAYCDLWDDERLVGVGRYDEGWGDDFWFARVRIGTQA
jgi:hypothetical protein